MALGRRSLPSALLRAPADMTGVSCRQLCALAGLGWRLAHEAAKCWAEKCWLPRTASLALQSLPGQLSPLRCSMPSGQGSLRDTCM